ncbi:MAG: hypothetical protein ABIO95_05245 [Bdellovibrionota bacterium]
MIQNSRSLVALSFILAACGNSAKTTFSSSPRSDLSSDIAPRVDFALVDATPDECPAGGSSLLTYIDTNASGSYDADDDVKSRSKVCNGYGSGIAVSSAPPESCDFGGSVFKTFIDRNQNGSQDLGETTTSVNTICNGAPGLAGTEGAAARLSVRVATSSECRAGGYVYTSSQSGQGGDDVSVVCSGTNGSDGTDGANGQNASYSMGAVGPMVSGKSFSACHHDYLYLPDSNNSERGWLTFRHQGNGSFDQGIGATGFQVWNVDISNFNLASEVGGVNYCSLTWDAVTRKLHYEVIDTTDGLGGTQGEIQL